MSNRYRKTSHLEIKIHAQKGRRFAILVEPFSPECKSFVWKNLVCDHGDSANTFELDATPHAWVGSNAGKTNDNNQFDGDWFSGKADIGTETNNGSTWTVEVSSGIATGLKETVPTSAPDKFEIDVPVDAAAFAPIYVGLGYFLDEASHTRIQEGGTVGPTSALLLDERSLDKDLRLNVNPPLKFFIVQNDAGPNELWPAQVVDFDKVTKGAAVIDFSAGDGLKTPTANVTHKEDGTYEVTYDC